MSRPADSRHSLLRGETRARSGMGRAVDSPVRIPVLPGPIARVLGALPAAALGWPLQQVIGSLALRHPLLFERLGDHASRAYLIDPTDLPFAFRLRPRPAAPRVEIVRRPVRTSWDARIAGPLAALLGMVHGALDGDALFFSRDLSVEGNVEAVLALRNAIDDAEIDLLAEAAAALGPFGPMLDLPGRAVLPWVERATGVALTRAGRAA